MQVWISRIVIDPGLGFGKRKEQNFTLIELLPALSKLELPMMIGPSRKSFLGAFDPKQPDYATAAAVAACVLNGAHTTLRVGHTVRVRTKRMRSGMRLRRKCGPGVHAPLSTRHRGPHARFSPIGAGARHLECSR